MFPLHHGTELFEAHHAVFVQVELLDHVRHLLFFHLPAITGKYLLQVVHRYAVGVVGVEVLEDVPEVLPLHEESGVQGGGQELGVVDLSVMDA